MKGLIVLFVALLNGHSSHAQEENTLATNSMQLARPAMLCECVDFPDEVSAFPGGTGGWNEWLMANIIYPETSRERGEQGSVNVAFVIERDGSITNVEIIRGVSPELDREAMRLVSSMPNWSPALIKGKLVHSRCSVGIKFKLL